MEKQHWLSARLQKNARDKRLATAAFKAGLATSGLVVAGAVGAAAYSQEASPTNVDKVVEATLVADGTALLAFGVYGIAAFIQPFRTRRMIANYTANQLRLVELEPDNRDIQTTICELSTLFATEGQG